MITRALARVARLIGVAAIVVSGCGGQDVQLIDVQDRTLPIETRRWLADAEDGVIVARDWRDRARQDLAEAQAWQDRATDIDWPRGGDSVSDALERLAEARTARATARLEYAEASLALAKRKHLLANAERAMLHDLAQYDLNELRHDVDDARRETDTLFTRLRRAQAREDQSVTSWWTAYASYVGHGGNRAPLWLASSAGATSHP